VTKPLSNAKSWTIIANNGKLSPKPVMPELPKAAMPGEKNSPPTDAEKLPAMPL
jgi:hypothetical protein